MLDFSKIDWWETRRAVEYVLNEAGSAHHPTALEGEEACVMLAFAHGASKS